MNFKRTFRNLERGVGQSQFEKSEAKLWKRQARQCNEVGFIIFSCFVFRFFECLLWPHTHTHKYTLSGEIRTWGPEVIICKNSKRLYHEQNIHTTLTQTLSYLQKYRHRHGRPTRRQNGAVPGSVMNTWKDSTMEMTVNVATWSVTPPVPGRLSAPESTGILPWTTVLTIQTTVGYARTMFNKLQNYYTVVNCFHTHPENQKYSVAPSCLQQWQKITVLTEESQLSKLHNAENVHWQQDKIKQVSTFS